MKRSDWLSQQQNETKLTQEGERLVRVTLSAGTFQILSCDCKIDTGKNAAFHKHENARQVQWRIQWNDSIDTGMLNTDRAATTIHP